MIKNYQEYVNESAGVELTQEQKKWLDKCTKGRWQFNPQTGEVDVQGDFYCNGQELDSFKGVRFGHVSEDFYCYSNKLTSLEGAPKSVGRDFLCYENNLTSLEGAPQSVGEDFLCYSNKLTSLEGAPQSVGGDFLCFRNSLTSLEGAPKIVGDEFEFYYNNLTSLKGYPEEIGKITSDPFFTPIWDQIGHLVNNMKNDEKNFFYKFVASQETVDVESLERIARSIERMRMI